MRLYHTVSHLRGRQLFGQISHRLKKRFENPAKFLQQVGPVYPGCCWSHDIDILSPGTQSNQAADILSGRITFLNHTQSVGWVPDWQCEIESKLWRYNLHYFEWLWALEFADVRTVVLDWIEKHPLAKDQVGWEPYPVSLRIMNLCGLCFGKYRQQIEADEPFLRSLWQSIYLQVEWLKRHLETHLLGNHYLENAAALAFAGSCFTGKTTQRWLDQGLNILNKEIPEQILSDGTHFELSPMYHSRILYLLAILAAAGNARIVSEVEGPLKRMVRALKHLCHPDDQIALLNDSAFGIYNAPDQLLEYCQRVAAKDAELPVSGHGSFVLPDAGYYGWRSNNGNYIICDAGKIGPDYIPGHAHADIFNFELSLNGHRVVVDSGVYDYEVSDTRGYCRSTAAHNTVEIEGTGQCVMWKSFRVGQRGYPREIEYKTSDSGFSLSGWHDGYQRLKGRPSHHRRFVWNDSGVLMVYDRVRSETNVHVVSRLHLHPECQIKEVSGKCITIDYPAGCVMVIFSGPGKMDIEDSYYYPEFGKRLANRCLAFSTTESDIDFGFAVAKGRSPVTFSLEEGATRGHERYSW